MGRRSYTLRRDERFVEIVKESEYRYQLKMLQVENEHNKYELEHERQEKKIMEKNLDSISDPFEREVKKIEIIEKMTRKSQQNGTSGPSDGKFSNCNEYDGGNYGGDYHLISFYVVSLSFG